MIKFLFILISGVLLRTCPVFSQANSSGRSIQPIDNNLYEAGFLLKKYTKQRYFGLGAVIGGTILINSSITEDSNGSVNFNSELATIGTISILAGSVLMMISHSNIGKAGDRLMLSAQSLTFHGKPMSGLGIGVAWKLRKKKTGNLIAGY